MVDELLHCDFYYLRQFGLGTVKGFVTLDNIGCELIEVKNESFILNWHLISLIES
jgi:hypothetical protein